MIIENELYHHGILGMHWGIRRYQPYGSGGYNPEHEGKYVGKEAKKRNKSAKYTAKEIEKLYTSNDDYKGEKVNYFVDSDKYISEKKKELDDKYRDSVSKNAKAILERTSQLSDQTNAEMLKKYGYFPTLSAEEQRKYMIDGQKYMDQISSNDAVYGQLIEEHRQLSKSYEKEITEFIDDYLQDYGKVKLPGTISVNVKTGKVSEYDISTIASISASRHTKDRYTR